MNRCGNSVQRHTSFPWQGGQPAVLPAAFLAIVMWLAHAARAQEIPAPPAAPMATNLAGTGVATSAVVSVSTTQLMDEAEALLTTDKKGKARDLLLAALDGATNAALRGDIETKLGPLNVELVRLPWPMPEKVDYTVQAGDSIRAIAQKHGTTVELIVEGNRMLRPDHIEPGDRLRVFNGKLAITVNKTRNDLLLTSDGRFFKRYRVGTGKYGRTPVGTYVLSDRIKDPPWWRGDGKIVPFGDKENILGTRWLALKATGATPGVKGYGIHGTWDNDSIGKAESAGCIRLRNDEVEELFLLAPVGTEVTIEE